MTTYARISMAITLSGRLGPFIILKKARINVTDKMTKVIFVASVRKFMSLFSSGDVVVMVLVIQASNPYRQTSPGMIQTAGVQISLFFKFLIYKTGIGGTTFYLKRVPISGELKLPIRSVNAYWFYVMPHYLYDNTGLMIKNLFSLF